MPDTCNGSHGYSLILRNGVEWRVAAGDVEAEGIVSRWAHSLMLRPASNHGPHAVFRSVSVEVSDTLRLERSPEKAHSLCVLPRNDPGGQGGDFPHFTNISAAITVDAHETGAILVHGALAERTGRGIILAAPGGTGKSTASRRLPHRWHSLCDDTTFLARDDTGNWFAHPWPTWSTFLDGGMGGRWDVSVSVPLEAVFFLVRSETESVETLGRNDGLIRILKSSSQVSSLATAMIWDAEQKRKINTRWFENLADVAASVPMYRLCLSLNGEFWKNLDHVISDAGAVDGSLE